MFTEMLRYILRQCATCLVTLSLNSLKTKQVEISMRTRDCWTDIFPVPIWFFLSCRKEWSAVTLQLIEYKIEEYEMCFVKQNFMSG